MPKTSRTSKPVVDVVDSGRIQDDMTNNEATVQRDSDLTAGTSGHSRNSRSPRRSSSRHHSRTRHHSRKRKRERSNDRRSKRHATHSRSGHKKRKNKHRRRSPSTSPDNSTSGESSSNSSSYSESNDQESDDSYKHVFVPPTTAFGSHIGSNVTKRIKKRIANHEYIDFSDLITLHVSSSASEQLSIAIDSDNKPYFEKKQSKKSLTFYQWNEAFDIFHLIYVQNHPAKSIKDHINLTRELLTYRKHIMDIVKQGGNWYDYDKHFRTEMVARGDSWSTIRFDLQMLYNINYKQNRPLQKSQPTRKTQQTSVCFPYNTRGDRCIRIPCPYRHVCQSCFQPHPKYACTLSTSYRRDSATGGRPSHVPFRSGAGATAAAQHNNKNNTHKFNDKNKHTA